MHGGEFDLNSRLREGTEAIAIFPPTRVMEELPAVPMKTVGGARRRSA
jgi:two-component system cell cycle sensor histidine kinase PleC